MSGLGTPVALKGNQQGQHFRKSLKKQLHDSSDVLRYVGMKNVKKLS
jgi:hypothetical protein